MPKLTVGQLKELIKNASDKTEVTFEWDEDNGGVFEYKGTNDSFTKEDDDLEDDEDYPNLITILLHNLER